MSDRAFALATGFAYVEIEPLTSEGQPPPKCLATLPR
jgi:hypothetical protein